MDGGLNLKMNVELGLVRMSLGMGEIRLDRSFASRSSVWVMVFRWIYPINIEIKDTADTAGSASCNWQRNKLLSEKRVFQFSHSELSIYM